jgi:hypothetical protein
MWNASRFFMSSLRRDRSILVYVPLKRVPAEPLVPDSSPFEVEMVIEKMKRYKSPGSDKFW